MNDRCDDCGNAAHAQLTTPMAQLCFNCWDGVEIPLETRARLCPELSNVLGDALAGEQVEWPL